jgi:hypothetical protein
MAADPTDYEMAREYLARCVANPLQAAAELARYRDAAQRFRQALFFARVAQGRGRLRSPSLSAIPSAPVHSLRRHLHRYAHAVL